MHTHTRREKAEELIGQRPRGKAQVEMNLHREWKSNLDLQIVILFQQCHVDRRPNRLRESGTRASEGNYSFLIERTKLDSFPLKSTCLSLPLVNAQPFPRTYCFNGKELDSIPISSMGPSSSPRSHPWSVSWEIWGSSFPHFLPGILKNSIKPSQLIIGYSFSLFRTSAISYKFKW